MQEVTMDQIIDLLVRGFKRAQIEPFIVFD